jgi:hypothetical protein
VRPSKLIEYWSTRPLDKNEFFNMIHRDYKVVFTSKSGHGAGVQEGQLRLLKDFLYQSNGQLPVIKRWMDLDGDDIEYLIYYSHDTAWPLVASRIDTSYNPILEEDALSNPSYTGISNYGEGDEGQLSGIEIEFERFMVTVFEDEDQWDTTQYSLREFLQDSQIQYDAANYGYAYDKVSAYLQLAYKGTIGYPILNHPGGIP